MSASPAAAIFGGSGGKGKKKATGLAGLFSEILSQAQKNFGMKTPEGAKAAPPVKGETATKAASNAAVPSVAKAAEKGKALQPRLAAAEPAATRVVDASGVRFADDAKARGAHEKRPIGHAEEAESADAAKEKLRKAVDDKRRTKGANEGKADETASVHAALAASKPIPANPIAPKPKAAQGEGEADSSIGAAKKADRASSEPKVTVLDLRRSIQAKRDASATADASAKPDDVFKEAVRDGKGGGHGSGQELVRDLSLGAKAAGDTASPWKADSSLAAGQGSDFQAMLAERMRDSWNGEIVKNAHIVLKDGDAGTIRLRLKPESLGNVKIELNLSDNNISGRIIVESDEAKNAFERNMSELADAFRQGGFDSARLEVAVGGGSGGGASGKGADADDSSGPFFSARLRSAVGSSADPATAASAFARRGGAVDILA